MLHADERALLALARRHWLAAIRVALVTLPIAIAILVVEYRAMLLAIIVLSAPLIAAITAHRARRQAELDRFLVAEAHPQGLLVRTARGEQRCHYDSSTHFAATTDTIVIVVSKDKQWQRWEVPGSAEAAAAFIATIRAYGGTVTAEHGPAALVGLLLGVLTGKVLGAIASVLVLAGLTHIVLALLDRGGSYGLGFALLGGALACLTVVALGMRMSGLRSSQ